MGCNAQGGSGIRVRIFSLAGGTGGPVLSEDSPQRVALESSVPLWPRINRCLWLPYESLQQSQTLGTQLEGSQLRG